MDSSSSSLPTITDNDDDGDDENDDGITGNSDTDEVLVAAASVCGNGTLERPEECDDSNRRDDDGCNSVCLLEIGICGDGVVQSLLGEQCEQSLHNSSLPYSCIGCLFLSTNCGDGKIDIGEECDDGQRNSTSPDATCRPNCHVSSCGDGVLDSAEICDDGNRLKGDGCDRFCRLEELKKSEVAAMTVQDIVFPTSQTFPTPQIFNFPQYPNYQQLPYQLPYAQLQPLIQTQGPVGDTGPAAVAVIGAGAAGGLAWIRRRRR